MVKFSKYDFSDYLQTEDDIKVYLDTAFEDGDSGFIAYALGNVAKARGMGKVAKKAKMNRTSLYRALARNSKPYFETISSVVNSLGYRLILAPQR